MVPCNGGSISESAQRWIRPFYIPAPPLLLLLATLSSTILPGVRLLANVAKRESDPDAGKSRASISPPFAARLLNARFPDYARFSSLERLRETLFPARF